MTRITAWSCSGLVGSGLMLALSIPRWTISRIDLFEVKLTAALVEVRSTYLIRDEKRTLDMICIDSRVFEVLAQAVRVP